MNIQTLVICTRAELATPKKCSLFIGRSLFGGCTKNKVSFQLAFVGWEAGRSVLTGGCCSEVVVNTDLAVHLCCRNIQYLANRYLLKNLLNKIFWPKWLTEWNLQRFFRRIIPTLPLAPFGHSKMILLACQF
jgi:hypothetical protein